MTNHRPLLTDIPSAQTGLPFQKTSDSRNSLFSRGFSLCPGQLCTSRQATSTWIEEMILMNIVEGVHGKWSTNGCLLVGSGLPVDNCMRKHVYISSPVCQNLSTRHLPVGGNISIGSCLFEETYQGLFHLAVKENMSTSWNLSVKNDCPVIGLICLKAHLYLFFVALFLSQRWKFLFGKISAFRCLDIFSEFASKNLA